MILFNVNQWGSITVGQLKFWQAELDIFPLIYLRKLIFFLSEMYECGCCNYFRAILSLEMFCLKFILQKNIYVIVIVTIITASMSNWVLHKYKSIWKIMFLCSNNKTHIVIIWNTWQKFLLRKSWYLYSINDCNWHY